MQVRELYVEKGTEDGTRAIKAMVSSGLGFRVRILSRKEAKETTEDYRAMPRILTLEGIFDGLESVELYARVYGCGGPWYKQESPN